jgi:2-keto-4-pentenoate hydratase/2-oxohepta-3-ene-1,7-dioic acid hydratase in catechol pathway
MKLVTFTTVGSGPSPDQTRVGAFTDGGIVDLTAAGLPATMIELLSLEDGIARARELASSVAATISLSEAHLEAPVPRPGKVLAIGLNYRDHAEESGQPIPQRPVVFAKMPGCITGPGAPVYMPRVSRALDWEAELCFVIGRRARYVKADDAARYVAGYMCGNDISVRDWQFHSPTWMMGKSFDTHGPTGPWLVTPDEIDVGHLDVRLFVNGEQKQHSNTEQLIFGVGPIIEYLSAGFTLEPGDVVFTGTPAGVGGAMKPPQFLKVGDVVRVEITGLGVLENTVTEEPV